MIEWFKDRGKTSTLRVAFFACVFTACFIGGTAAWKNEITFETAALVAVFLASAFTGKVQQKKIEVIDA
jgi:hypothetical protein